MKHAARPHQNVKGVSPKVKWNKNNQHLRRNDDVIVLMSLSNGVYVDTSSPSFSWWQKKKKKYNIRK